MAVAVVQYEQYRTVVGTLAEVMGYLKDVHPKKIISIIYDATDSKIVAITNHTM